MGIPKYHRWLMERYPGAFGEAQGESAHHVYVDANALLHDVMRHTSIEDGFFQHLFAKLDGLFRIVHPNRSVFLAVDGPASWAKCLTQRQRRRDHAQKDARNAKLGKGKDKSKGKAKGGGKAGGESKLSNNMLMPGVPFMTKLTGALEYYVASRMLAGRPLASCEWATVSGAHAIGEGEHKIVSQMLRNAGASEVAESHVIFSGDADIFLLSLVQNACRQVRVVPERPENQWDQSKRKRGTMLQIWNAEVLAGSICQELTGGRRGPRADPGCLDGGRDPPRLRPGLAARRERLPPRAEVRLQPAAALGPVPLPAPGRLRLLPAPRDPAGRRGPAALAPGGGPGPAGDGGRRRLRRGALRALRLLSALPRGAHAQGLGGAGHRLSRRERGGGHPEVRRGPALDHGDVPPRLLRRLLLYAQSTY